MSIDRGESPLPPQGKFKPLSPDLPEAQTALAQTVRDLVNCTDLTLRKCADEIHSSDSTLSRWIQGDLRPDENQLRELFDTAANRVGKAGLPTWDQVVSHLQMAEREVRFHRTKQVKYDVAWTCHACGAAKSESGKRADDSLRAPSAVAPVPSSDGDRRNGNPHASSMTRIPWPPAKDLAAYLADGNLERANGLIRHVGVEASTGETADAVASCRDVGLPEAAETIVRYAGNRRERDVLEILQALVSHGRRNDADSLLEYALGVSRHPGQQ